MVVGIVFPATRITGSHHLPVVFLSRDRLQWRRSLCDVTAEADGGGSWRFPAAPMKQEPAHSKVEINHGHVGSILAGSHHFSRIRRRLGVEEVVGAGSMEVAAEN